MKRPAFQFYPADWLRDLSLRRVSPASRGLWIDLLCLMHDGEPYGYLRAGGQDLTTDEVGRATGMTPVEAKRAIAELERAGVFSRSETGTILSRRMVRDEKLRAVRAEGGQLGAPHGVKGGRPSATRKGAEEGVTESAPEGVRKKPLTPFENNPPSSSSSVFTTLSGEQTTLSGESKHTLPVHKKRVQGGARASRSAQPPRQTQQQNEQLAAVQGWNEACGWLREMASFERIIDGDGVRYQRDVASGRILVERVPLPMLAPPLRSAMDSVGEERMRVSLFPRDRREARELAFVRREFLQAFGVAAAQEAAHDRATPLHAAPKAMAASTDAREAGEACKSNPDANSGGCYD